MANLQETEAMRRAIALSALGLGTTSPNPPVGCVILDIDGQVVGTGYHRRKGEAHAEPQALTMAGPRANGGVAVVTLEPCNHVGLTPACHQSLLDAGIAKVVIAVIDPTSRAEGGAAALRSRGVDVEVGLLEHEAQQVLGRWMTATTRRRPFVTWSYAVSGNGPAPLDDILLDDLRAGIDVVIHADDQVEEGIPGGHGDGQLRLPAGLSDQHESPLTALYEGGARTVLLNGTSRLIERLILANTVDEIIIEIRRDQEKSTGAAEPALLPPGFKIDAVMAGRRSIRLVGRRIESQGKE